MNWKFVCPMCGHIASVKDWKDVGASEGEIAFSCIGRHKDLSHFTEDKGPCNYAGGGLFQMNPVTVMDGGIAHKLFDFALPDK